MHLNNNKGGYALSPSFDFPIVYYLIRSCSTGSHSIVLLILTKKMTRIYQQSKAGKELIKGNQGSRAKLSMIYGKIMNRCERIKQETKIVKGNAEHILLVDDESSILLFSKEMLKRIGYHVVDYCNSFKALETFRKYPDKFDLVITDLTMPDMAGDKLSAELIKIRPDIPIILWTGGSETFSEDKAVSIGIKCFLYKPITMKDLSQKIYELLEENRGK